MAIRIFGIDLVITAAALVVAGIVGGPQTALIVAILIVLEISLSFDNAVINATILRRMSPFWQRLFLTVGILIAVFGMRLLFPIVIVALTAHLSPGKVLDLAINSPSQYADKLDAAHPAIAAFGGIFLFMIFLDFMFDEERDIHWLHWIEKPLSKVAGLAAASTVVALVCLLVVGEFFSGEDTQQVLTAGVAGLATYLAVGGLGDFFESRGATESDDEPSEAAEDGGGVTRRQVVGVTGKAAFFLFLYLEVLDASFSFDGVVGAFAIDQRIFVIAAGLGVGALYIRSLTVYLVRKGTLSEYVFLEHGAHYAIGALAIILAVSIETDVPEVVTGLIGVGFIGAAFVSSLVRRRRIQEEDDATDTPDDDTPDAVRVPAEL